MQTGTSSSMTSWTFWLNDRQVQVPPDVPPETTLLRYLRDRLRLTGTKEACGEGDCGACTVVLLDHPPGGAPTYRAVNSCLLLLPLVAGRRVYTVEGLRVAGSHMDDPSSGLHPVQRAIVEHGASQCGFCTPGVAMSLLEACYRDDVQRWDAAAVEEQLGGNLCRCTGYRPIRDAALDVAGLAPDDRFSRNLREYRPADRSLDIRLAEHRWAQPRDLEGLWRALEEMPSARVVAGGTDLALEVTKQHRQLPQVVSLEAIDELRFVRESEGGWSVGACTTLTDLASGPGAAIPALGRMVAVFGSRQVRNRATVGGNLCNASPIGDLAPVFMALGASVVLRSRDARRELPLEDFFLGYRRTALRPGEILYSVELPRPPSGSLSASYKVSRRRDLDISTVSAAFYLELDKGGDVARCRVALGGVAPVPLRALAAEAVLQGRPWTQATVDGAMDAVERDVSPISDVRASAAYRSSVSRNLLQAFFLETTGRLEDLPPGLGMADPA